MNKTRAKVHPGVRMFGNAMAGIVGSTSHRKSKSAVLKEVIESTEVAHAESTGQIKTSEDSVLMYPQSQLESKTHLLADIDDNYLECILFDNPPVDDVDYSLPLKQNKTHLLQDIDDSYPENIPFDNPPDDVDYSLPVTQCLPPPGFDTSPASLPNPQFYPTSTPFSYNTENTMCYSSFDSPMDQWGCFNPLLQSPVISDVYAFNLSTVLPRSWVQAQTFADPRSFGQAQTFADPVSFGQAQTFADPVGFGQAQTFADPVGFGQAQTFADPVSLEQEQMFADPGCLEQASMDTLDESFDYRLPLTLPGDSQDSGCVSSEDSRESSSSETSLKEIPCSLSYYHTVNSSERPSSPQQVPNSESPVKVPPQPKEKPVISGRVSRRSMSRVQGPTTSLSTGTKSVIVPRRSLPVAIPQYISTEVSDDSGAEISPDEDPSPLRSGCRSCEKESEMLFKADAQRRWRPLPDYSRIDFLAFKSTPGFIDSHCHLDFLFQRQNYDGTYADYMLKHKDTYPASYEGCVAVFCNPYTFHKKYMWQRYLNENGVWGAFGCHPHNANAYSDLMDSDLCEALNHPKVQALGEIGLDYSNRNDCSKEKQHAVFRRQLKMALVKKLPLVIHCRDANEDIMRIMKEILPRNHLIHLHCFTDGWDWAQKWLSEFPNLFIGITNLVTYSSAQPTHDVAKRIPLHRLLLETDAPYFIPRMSPRTTKYSHPGMAIHVAAQIATLRSIPLKEVIHRTRQNTQTMYGI